MPLSIRHDTRQMTDGELVKIAARDPSMSSETDSAPSDTQTGRRLTLWQVDGWPMWQVDGWPTRP